MVMKSDFNFITFNKIGGMEFVLNCDSLSDSGTGTHLLESDSQT